jgi:hypothetical protein
MRPCFFLLFGTIFIILNCKKQLADEGIQPAPVYLIPAVHDTCRIEKGIDAIPDGNAISLQWLPSKEDIVRGYAIYRSDVKKGVYQIIADETVLSQFDSLFFDFSITLNKRYYYFIVAVSDEDMQSEPSDTLDYKLIEKASQLSIQQGENQLRPVFQWKDPNAWQASPYYVIRLVSVINGDYVWISQISPQFGSEFQQIIYNEDGTAAMDSLVPGRDYDWRIDVAGSENNSGSESQWSRFQL